MCISAPFHNHGQIDAIIGVHVDDVILACPESKLKKTKAIFSKAYDMKDLGELSWYLGMKVDWSKDRKKCFMSHSAMIQEILEEHGPLQPEVRPGEKGLYANPH